jgi:hypothetical protein
MTTPHPTETDALRSTAEQVARSCFDAVAARGAHAGGRYILHHRTPVSQGGDPFDPGNILVVTPRYHREILDKGYHSGR